MGVVDGRRPSRHRPSLARPSGGGRRGAAPTGCAVGNRARTVPLTDQRSDPRDRGGGRTSGALAHRAGGARFRSDQVVGVIEAAAAFVVWLGAAMVVLAEGRRGL